MCERFDQFKEKFGESIAYELLERICEAHCRMQKRLDWNGGTAGDGVKFSNIYKHDVCNYTLSGQIEFAGETYYFIIDNGNYDGTVVREFGGIDDVSIYKPPKPIQFMFVPEDDDLKEKRPSMYKVYQNWTKEKWFIEQLAKYHYDRYFQPGNAIETHYKKWVASKGMKIVTIKN